MLTQEQRARIEENRRKAEEKLRKKVAAANSSIRALSNNSNGHKRSEHTFSAGGTPSKQTTLLSFFKIPQSAKATTTNAESTTINKNDTDSENRISMEENTLLSSPLAQFNLNDTANGLHSSLPSRNSPSRRVLFKTDQSSTNSNSTIKEITTRSKSSIERDVMPSSLIHFQSLDDDDDEMDMSTMTTTNNENATTVEPISNVSY